MTNNQLALSACRLRMVSSASELHFKSKLTADGTEPMRRESTAKHEPPLKWCSLFDSF